MACSQVSQQVVVPDIGFAASIGTQSRYGKGRETEDRSSPDVIEYLALAFVALAVAFGPAIVSLL
jgi:hypothetical protein